MLSSLYIRNVAVIAKASLTLEDGLNVFTGETGAGKSILISAINAVLGERSSKDLVRSGETKAEITALFTDISADAQEALAQAGYDYEPEEGLLVQREITAEGKSVCRIGGRPATVSVLKTITPLLIHIHGQHDTRQLLSQTEHMRLLDAYGDLFPLRQSCADAYRAYRVAKQELESLTMDAGEVSARIDLLQSQIDEILDADLQPGEEESLLARRKVLSNALDIAHALEKAETILSGADGSSGLVNQLYTVSDCIQEVGEYIEEAVSMGEQAADAYYQMEALGRDLRRLLGAVDTDPESLELVEERLALIQDLRQKYGNTVEEINAYEKKAEDEMTRLENLDNHSAAMQERVKKLLETAQKVARQLSDARRNCAVTFCQSIQEELAYLDMPGVSVSVEMAPKPLGADGIDEVALYVRTNTGEAPKPMAKIASGGELSRIMLSIQNVLADKGSVQTMIFDEVDTGVSGRAAQKVGRKLRKAAQNRQVLVVTHLGQVAAFAHNHLLIAKETQNGRTFTSVNALDEAARVDEIARLTGGETLTETARANARELIALAQTE